MTVFERVRLCNLSIAMKEQETFSRSIGLIDKTHIVDWKKGKRGKKYEKDCKKVIGNKS